MQKHDEPNGVFASPEGQPREGFDAPGYGNAFWFTLFSSDKTATSGMSAGVMVLPPNGGRLQPHRHQQAELYFIAAGTGTLTINGTETVIAAGAAAFIPGDAQHSLRNDAPEELRVFYVFPTDSFADVVYHFEQPNHRSASSCQA